MYTQIEKVDLRSFYDLVGPGEWSLKKDGLYYGETFVGDGTVKNANKTLLKNFYDKTDGAFCLIYMRIPDEGLGICKDETSLDGFYKEGHYICVTKEYFDDYVGEVEFVGYKIKDSIADGIELSNIFNYIYDFKVNGKPKKHIVNCTPLRAKNSDEIIGILIVSRDVLKVSEKGTKQSLRIAFILFAVILIFLGILLFVLKNNTKDLNDIVDYLSKIGNGNLPDEKLVLQSKGNFKDVETAINSMVSSFRENERLEGELKLASEIQTSMLPKYLPGSNIKEYDIYADMVPAKEVGGDFYDFFKPDDTHLALIIADVSGKGVPASIFMAITKTIIKNLVCMGFEVDDIFNKVNLLLCEDNKEEMFVTAWLGIIDLETGIMTYVNAGHNPPLLCKDGKYEYMKMRSGLVLAAMENIQYKAERIELNPGDKLLLYTDGVTEATDSNNEFFGEERFKNLLQNNVSLGVKALTKEIYETLKLFAGGTPQADDITVLAFTYKEKLAGLFAKKQDFDASNDALDEATGWLEEYLESIECPIAIVTQLNIALEEIFVNISSYAYKNTDGKITLAVGYIEEEKSVILRFYDSGYAFNPLEIKNPDMTLKVEERSIGGLGIYMVTKTMDEVDYKRFELKNILTLKKKIC